MTSIRMSAPRRRMFSGIILSCGLIWGLAGVTGCAGSGDKNKSSSGYSMPSDDQVASLRDAMQRANPGSMVGSVIATLDDARLAAVVGIPVKEIKLGQVISFADVNGSPVNVGTVVGISIDPTTEDSINVKFDATGKRPVHRGDLAVWLKE